MTKKEIIEKSERLFNEFIKDYPVSSYKKLLKFFGKDANLGLINEIGNLNLRCCIKGGPNYTSDVTYILNDVKTKNKNDIIDKDCKEFIYNILKTDMFTHENVDNSSLMPTPKDDEDEDLFYEEFYEKCTLLEREICGPVLYLPDSSNKKIVFIYDTEAMCNDQPINIIFNIKDFEKESREELTERFMHSKCIEECRLTYDDDYLIDLILSLENPDFNINMPSKSDLIESYKADLDSMFNFIGETDISKLLFIYSEWSYSDEIKDLILYLDNKIHGEPYSIKEYIDEFFDGCSSDIKNKFKYIFNKISFTNKTTMDNETYTEVIINNDIKLIIFLSCNEVGGTMGLIDEENLRKWLDIYYDYDFIDINTTKINKSKKKKKETEKDKIERVLENLKNGKRMNREEMIHLLENYKCIYDEKDD